MDGDQDDKSIVEKTVEAVKGLAATISEAARKTAEPEQIKSGDEVVVMPLATAGLMSETVVPPIVVIRRPRNSTKTRAISARNGAKTKSAKTAPTKKSAKKTKSPTTRTAVGKKTRKRTQKTKAKKSRR